MSVPAARRPTLKDVAHAAGVSLKTASRVVNGVDSVDAAMASRVRAACARLGYQRNGSAADLRGGVSSTIGLIIRDITNPFYAAIAAGAMAAADERHLVVLAASSEGRVGHEQLLLDRLLDRRPSGMIVTPADVDHVPTGTEQSRFVPFVTVDTDWPDLPFDHVSLDNDGGMTRLVDTAISAGFRDFALIVDSFQLRTMWLRREAAHAALRRHGLDVAPGQEMIGAHTIDDAAAVMGDLLSRGHRPDAVLCGNNRIALGVASTVVAAGLTTAIVCFDEFPLADALPVDVIAAEFDPRDLGRTAVELLLSRLEDPDAPPRRVALPTTLNHHTSGGRR
ncbi:LacI family DNA-binding transcriptional regulator [Mobilicoccus caccae]|uniref:LacI family transcriptional regulator n=1 Tax=Mobilicoccus caccae TaxID=1859295 RepID=A0ABQ6IKV2_9MICO|nr:LacI family DNA-binding transcriptional regulator [Mobilicoccus caccae]GMA38381.1 LacI family transcriptional regulator [Mobilicoccus caccae]